MVAYLNRESVRHRDLNHEDWELLGPMIRRSDNVAATRVFNIVGAAGLKGLAHRVGMQHFATNPIWGLTQICAAPTRRSSSCTCAPSSRRATARRPSRCCARSIPEQRWGIARARPDGWKIYFKGGWGSGSGAVDHQIALLTKRRRARVDRRSDPLYNPDHLYGKHTEEGVARRLLRGLAAR